MAEESDDGFNPSQIVKKADLGGLGVDSDTEDVLKEFNFLTQPVQVCSLQCRSSCQSFPVTS